MKHKHVIISAALAVAGFGTAIQPAFGFAEVGRGKLTATARLALEYDSSIFANSSETADWSMIFTPSISYARTAGTISTNARLSVNSINFQDTSGQDTIDPSLTVTVNVDRAEKGAFAQSISYTRQTAANETLNTRAESDEYRGVTRLDYYFSEKTGFRFNANYRLSDFLSSGYNGIRSYSLGGGIVYRYSPKLTAFLTSSYNPEKAIHLGTAPISDPSSKNYRVRLGLEGQLAPKLSGSVAIGVVHRDFDLGGSTEAFLVSSAVSWSASEKTSIGLSASNDFDTSPGAESMRVLNTVLSIRQTIDPKFNVGATLGYQYSRLNQLPGPVARTDEAETVGVNASYRITDNLTLNGNFNHRINDSTLARAEYTRDVLNIAANFSF